ncbi:la-related protein 6 [Austrofundulus limnaeus]|uniref:La-related protein 6 n=1 Tax=Austrofundulus limnaeus TaxID=52670 RepID=A0A2I4B590_AUSLI|nr:PREDICTED: la-related protein 6-like [Austrofundulus limnaeus]
MFSDGHLAEDGFLLKHIQRNKQGYVSLRLVTSLKKIKALTSDWYMTLAAANCSDLLEVNDECSKVRRKEPLPQWLMDSPTSRLLLLWNKYDNENPSLVLKALEKFTVPDSVRSIWILHPGEEVPKVLQCYTQRHREIGQRLCVVVKFSHFQAVRSAFDALKEEEKVSKEGLRVMAMGWKSTQSGTKSDSSEEKPRNQPEEDPMEIPKVLLQLEASSLVKATEESSETFAPEVCQGWTTSCSSQSFRRLKQRYNRTSPGSGDHLKRSSQSPWVLKRKTAAGAGSSNNAEPPNAPRLITTVLRYPTGPDGTRGFNYRRE